MPNDVEILGLKELERRLKALPKNIAGNNLLGKSLRKAANIIRDEGRAKAPFGMTENNNDDVHIRNQLKVRRDPRPDKQGQNEIMYVKPFATKKFPVYYWRFWEFGTSNTNAFGIKIPRTRFLTKAFESKKKEAVTEFQKALTKLVISETRKLNK